MQCPTSLQVTSIASILPVPPVILGREREEGERVEGGDERGGMDGE